MDTKALKIHELKDLLIKSTISREERHLVDFTCMVLYADAKIRHGHVVFAVSKFMLMVEYEIFDASLIEAVQSD